jgi:hypothetical protein
MIFLQLDGTLAHFFQGEINRFAAAGKGNRIAAVARRKYGNTVVKGLFDPLDTTLKALVITQ